MKGTAKSGGHTTPTSGSDYSLLPTLLEVNTSFH